MSKKNKKNNSKKNDGSKYATVYPDSAYRNDEKNFKNAMNNKSDIDWSGFSRLMIHDLCSNSQIIDTGYIGNVRLEDAQLALHHPRQGWKILMSISDELMRISPHYFRLNSLYSNMALFCWWVDLYGVKDNTSSSTIKKSYSALTEKLETMNLKHEFSKIMKSLPYQDIYCGVIVENQTDFFIQQIDFRLCKLYQVQDGLYNFKINLSAINPQKINAYPIYIRQAYIDFSEGKITNWYEPPADFQICIKLNSQWTYPYPLLIGLVRDILDLDIYKKLKIQSARTDNYKAIMVKVPIDENTIDKPLLTPETLGVFAEINRESMTDDIGLIYNLGSDGEAISFKESNNTRNNVADSVGNIYDSAGVSQELFNGSSSGTAVTFSVENDSGIVYSVYRQFERWINRYIKLRKYNKNAYKFSFYLLDITIFNRDNVSKRYKEACTLGATVIDKWLASLDITPSRMMGSYILHKDIFDFHNKFIPLSTSFNSKGEVGQGKTSNEEKGELLKDSGEQTKDSDANLNR